MRGIKEFPGFFLYISYFFCISPSSTLKLNIREYRYGLVILGVKNDSLNKSAHEIFTKKNALSLEKSQQSNQ